MGVETTGSECSCVLNAVSCGATGPQPQLPLFRLYSLSIANFECV